MPTMGADNGLSLYQLRGLDYNDEKWDQLLDQLSFEDMVTLINVGGWQTAEIKSVGKIATSDCDGPAGFSDFCNGSYGTAYPSELLWLRPGIRSLHMRSAFLWVRSIKTPITLDGMVRQ